MRFADLPICKYLMMLKIGFTLEYCGILVQHLERTTLS